MSCTFSKPEFHPSVLEYVDLQLSSKLSVHSSWLINWPDLIVYCNPVSFMTWWKGFTAIRGSNGMGWPQFIFHSMRADFPLARDMYIMLYAEVEFRSRTVSSLHDCGNESHDFWYSFALRFYIWSPFSSVNNKVFLLKINLDVTQSLVCYIASTPFSHWSTVILLHRVYWYNSWQ